MALVQHSSLNPDWGTPSEVIERVRKTFLLQDIYLDPASTRHDDEIVKARNYYSPEEGDDGLLLPWKAPNVFVNPPGGKHRNKSRQLIWWKKCVDEYHLRNFGEGIFLGFTIELLRLSQACPFSAFDFPFCVPSKRIQFRGRGTQPAHANVIVYLGEHHKTFQKVWSDYGGVSLPTNRWRAEEWKCYERE